MTCDENTLNQHTKVVHPKLRNYKRNDCNYISVKKGNLVRHTGDVHDNVGV